MRSQLNTRNSFDDALMSSSGRGLTRRLARSRSSQADPGSAGWTWDGPRLQTLFSRCRCVVSPLLSPPSTPPTPTPSPPSLLPIQFDSSPLCGSSNQSQMSSEHTSFLLRRLLSPLSQRPVDQPAGCGAPVCSGGGGGEGEVVEEEEEELVERRGAPP